MIVALRTLTPVKWLANRRTCYTTNVSNGSHFRLPGWILYNVFLSPFFMLSINSFSCFTSSCPSVIIIHAQIVIATTWFVINKVQMLSSILRRWYYMKCYNAATGGLFSCCSKRQKQRWHSMAPGRRGDGWKKGENSVWQSTHFGSGTGDLSDWYVEWLSLLEPISSWSSRRALRNRLCDWAVCACL